MAKSIEVYGIKYKFPEIPESSLIENFDLDKDDQKFYKIDIPDYFDELEFDEEGTPIYNDQQRDFVIQEMGRIYNGYWF